MNNYPFADQVAELKASRPYDGRRVTLKETRAGWTFTGISGICTRLASDRRRMVILVEHDPDSYWPIGMEILAELDEESVPVWGESTLPASWPSLDAITW